MTAQLDSCQSQYLSCLPLSEEMVKGAGAGALDEVETWARRHPQWKDHLALFGDVEALEALDQ